MGKTFAEKILALKSGQPKVEAGQIVQVRPEVTLSHDNSAAIIEIFRNMGGEHVVDPGMLAIFLDHAAPAPTTKHAENHRQIREFVSEQGLSHFYDIGRGICHQVLVEVGLALPGELILGADSHTPHAGVMGAFATGIGRSEMASVWALGELWLRVPESIRIEITGELQPPADSKDLALHVIGDQLADGALYMSVEWCGTGIDDMNLSQRAVLPNMMSEMGAKNSYLPPDEKVFAFLNDRAQRPFTPLYPDEDAQYTKRLTYNADRIEPMVACPHAVDNVQPLSAVLGRRVDQAFLGTCTNGRLEDLQAAAGILAGQRIAPNTRMVVIPASNEIYLAALEAGYIEIFLRAGAVVESPGCGPCMGNHMGVPAEGETTISTANRNFMGRMGTKESEIYLANPAVVAASAIAGEIAHPGDID